MQPPKRDRKLFVYLSEAAKQQLASLAGETGDSISATALRLIEAGLTKEKVAQRQQSLDDFSD